jgi:DNA-binding FadR family transcriptional regulator
VTIETAQRTTFGPLRARQRYERIAEEIAGEVRSGALRPGERLASERDLARRLEVGRSSVREAIAALQLEGILETRPGAGSYVAADARARLAARDEAPGEDAPAALPADASPSAVLEARLLLEPGVARLAAARRPRDPLLDELLEAMERAADAADPAARARWSDADRLFHRQLAVLTQNPVLVGLADQVAALMDQPLWRRLRDESLALPGHARLFLAEHRLLAAAVADGDADAAALHATQHLTRVRRLMALDP